MAHIGLGNGNGLRLQQMQEFVAVNQAFTRRKGTRVDRATRAVPFQSSGGKAPR